jgi:cytochrome b subunit of formate dehydrogenase
MRPPAEILRFTKGERWIHRTTAILMGICLVTAAILYVGALETLVGRRSTIEWIHVIAGCALPVPTIVGLASKAFRADIRRLNRFFSHDWAWLRSSSRRSGKLPVGKFNAGQKLNASFQVGAVLIMLGTGLIMRFANDWNVSWRTGATFVHDWIAYAILAVVVGHIYMAMRDPYALGGMRTGSVPLTWAKREHRAWAAEEEAARKTDNSLADADSRTT